MSSQISPKMRAFDAENLLEFMPLSLRLRLEFESQTMVNNFEHTLMRELEFRWLATTDAMVLEQVAGYKKRRGNLAYEIVTHPERDNSTMKIKMRWREHLSLGHALGLKPKIELSLHTTLGDEEGWRSLQDLERLRMTRVNLLTDQSLAMAPDARQQLARERMLTLLKQDAFTQTMVLANAFWDCDYTQADIDELWLRTLDYEITFAILAGFGSRSDYLAAKELPFELIARMCGVTYVEPNFALVGGTSAW